eukprot:TRINITY_DN2186_c0_g10_i1.p1 TRINITY_DN2186_c0_g10~~TRINITY_DN2186_c0_g10_i1.p1  ORF type:complete len:166 (-),score=31.72 TRINITY_DN2186_c0_g10_i1:53-550(-)
MHKRVKHLANIGHMTSLKRVKKKYEENDKSIAVRDDKSKKYFKVCFFGKKQDANFAKHRKKNIKGKDEVLMHFPLSVLRNNYREEELKRIRDLRRTNIKKINESFLCKFEEKTMKELEDIHFNRMCRTLNLANLDGTISSKNPRHLCNSSKPIILRHKEYSLLLP